MDDERILFKTQQKVERLEGGYALTDLYLPQLDLFIEVNEPYHELQSEADKQRNDDIVKVTHHSLLVIRCSEQVDGRVEWQPLAEIHRQIDECVALIKQLIAEKECDGGLKPWDMSQWLSVDYHKKEGILKAEKHDALSTIDDICELFGTKPKMRGFLRMGVADIPTHTNQEIWFPILKNDKKWVNELSEDKTIFCEHHQDPEKRREHISKVIKDNRQRVTFFKTKDALGMDVYHFLGVYELDQKETRKQEKCVWRRISTEYNLNG